MVRKCVFVYNYLTFLMLPLRLPSVGNVRARSSSEAPSDSDMSNSLWRICFNHRFILSVNLAHDNSVPHGHISYTFEEITNSRKNSKLTRPGYNHLPVRRFLHHKKTQRRLKSPHISPLSCRLCKARPHLSEINNFPLWKNVIPPPSTPPQTATTPPLAFFSSFVFSFSSLFTGKANVEISQSSYSIAKWQSK